MIKITKIVTYHNECTNCGHIWTDSLGNPLSICPKCQTIESPSWTKTIPNACVSCPNHPSNGGSGICHCILGSQNQITWSV